MPRGYLDEDRESEPYADQWGRTHVWCAGCGIRVRVARAALSHSLDEVGFVETSRCQRCAQ
jgi:hypothetical protein